MVLREKRAYFGEMMSGRRYRGHWIANISARTRAVKLTCQKRRADRMVVLFRHRVDRPTSIDPGRWFPVWAAPKCLVMNGTTRFLSFVAQTVANGDESGCPRNVPAPQPSTNPAPVIVE